MTVALSLCLTNCGGGSSTPPPPATIAVSLTVVSGTALVVGASASFTAIVANDTKNGGVTWTISCGGSACGTVNPASTASGTATTYTAPAAIPTGNVVTLTATSVSDTTKSALASITILAPISVVFSPTPPSSIAAGATSSLTAVVSSDSKNGGVTWTVTCGSTLCGSFSAASTASGTATSYTAPTAIPTGNAVTLTATSVSDTTKSASASITILPPPISVVFSPTPPSSIAVGATSSLTAIVSNDSKNGGATWKVTCGSTQCGSFSAASTASGTATTYTAPAAIPTGNVVTLTATSVSDTTKSVSATVRISVVADGTYVYHFSGYDSSGPSFFAGAFTVRSGAIASGEQDFADPKGRSVDTVIPTGSGLSNVGGNLQIVLATSNTKLGVNGVETLRGTLVSASRALLSEFDSFGAGTGSVDLQTSASAPSGGYAFVLSGWNLSTPVNTLVFGGVLNISGTSLSSSGSAFDYNKGGAVVQNQTFASGTVSAPDAFGRVSFNLTPSAASNVPNFILTGYIVGPGQIQLVQSQPDLLSTDLGGVALGQGSSTGQFSQATVANKTYVFGVSGQDVSRNLTTIGGTFIFGTNGSLSGTFAFNDLASAVGTITGGTYTVDSTGRVTLNNVTASQFATNDVFTFQFYLDGSGNALELGADSLEFTSGPAYLQTSTSTDFEGSYALVGQGFLNSQGMPAWGAVGPVSLSSAALTGFTDYTAQSFTSTTNPFSLTANQSLTGTETTSTGTLSLTGLDALAFTSPRVYSYFPIDNRRAIAIETDGNQLGLLTLEGISH